LTNVSICEICPVAVATSCIEKNGPNQEANAGNPGNDAQKGKPAECAPPFCLHLTHLKRRFKALWVRLNVASLLMAFFRDLVFFI
jgi:hypothetical protein